MLGGAVREAAFPHHTPRGVLTPAAPERYARPAQLQRHVLHPLVSLVVLQQVLSHPQIQVRASRRRLVLPSSLFCFGLLPAIFFFSTFLFVILRVTMTYDFYIPVSMVCTLLVPSSSSSSFISFTSSSSFSLYSFLSFSSYSSPCPHISLLYPLRNFSSHFIVLSDVR